MDFIRKILKVNFTQMTLYNVEFYMNDIIESKILHEWNYKM